MKGSRITLVFASIFLALLLVGIASATLTVSPLTLTFNNNNSKTVTVTSDASDTITFDSSFILNGITFDVSGNQTLDSNNRTILTVTPQGDINDFDFNKLFTSSFEVGDGVDVATVNVEARKNNFCSTGEENIGDLSLSIDLNDLTSTNDYFGDDDELYPLNNVEIEIEVKNNGDDDIDNIEIEWELWTSDGKQIMDGDENDFDLKDGDKEKLTFVLNLDPDDLDVDEENYVLYVRATGEVDNDDNDNTCTSNSENINVNIDDDFVVLDEDSLDLDNSYQCGTEVILSADIWNIGDDDQDDVQVRVYIKDLGIEEDVKVGDIDAFDSEPFDFRFEIPKDVDEKTYTLQFSVLDDDDDVYENDNDDEAILALPFTIKGGCSSTETSEDVDVGAVIQEGGKAGRPLVIKATIANSGDSQGTFTLNIANYASWAELSGVSQSTLVLGAGQSEDVLITLDVNKDVSGEQIFNVEVLSEGKVIKTQQIQVPLTERSGLSNLINGGNWQIWAIGALNLILVVIIIIVAIRIARR